MATMITEECINCGACEPECPNTAIYQGGAEWELNGVTHPPLSDEVFYIVPEKCTECVGFHDEEACATVCPVDVCIPNPEIPESEEVLIQRARELHPETDFPAGFPSRFSPGEGEGAAAADSPAAAPAAPAPAAAPAAPAPAAAVPVPAPVAAAPGGSVEKPVSPPATQAPSQEKIFPGELDMSFEAAEQLLEMGWVSKPSPAKLVVALAQPLLGALPHKQKREIERAVADRRFFSVAGSTGLNALQNVILYPIVLAAFGVIVLHRSVFSEQLKWLLFFGVLLATLEVVLRMRESFRGAPADEVVYRAAVYGLPLVPLAAPIVGMAGAPEVQGGVGQDGFTDTRFGEKLERERRYGDVFRVREDLNGCMLTFEFPRVVPPSAIRDELGVGDEMPDYEYDISLANKTLTIKGRVTEEKVRRIAAVSPAFPPDFTTEIQLPIRPAGFRHRFEGKTLEIALPRKV